jgi:NedA-like, galactose-binding domain
MGGSTSSGAHIVVKARCEGRWRHACACVALWLPGAAALADTVRVDAAPEHATNSIRPTEALGAGVDRLPYGAADKLFTPATLARVLSAGWQRVSYRQNTELHAEAWHWNPRGSWSGPGERGYFTGDARPGEAPIVHSFGYPLPRRGVTRDDGTDTIGYSRLTDGDPSTFWKSNPYLTQTYTGDEDAAHPQWVILDLASRQKLDAIRIEWAEPYARDYVVQFWSGEDPIRKPAAGSWQLFAHGAVIEGHGGRETLRLADLPVEAQFVRILMSRSSNTCVAGTHGDRRDCVGYAIGEVALGTLGGDGRFHDLIRHTPDQDQTATYCSSIDPWHASGDLDEKAGEQVGFDRFFTSGITRGLPAMIPIAMLYSTPEDAVAELSYLERRGYPIAYVEMGEEPDGHYTVPEDYAALYLQFAAALHRLDPRLKLGGPIFTGQNEDIQTWPDARGNVSWTVRFIDYLRAHGGLRSWRSSPSSTTRSIPARSPGAASTTRRASSPTSCRCGARTACRGVCRCSSPNPTSPRSTRRPTWTSGARCGSRTTSARSSPAAATRSTTSTTCRRRWGPATTAHREPSISFPPTRTSGSGSRCRSILPAG